mmetsp:Transcript_1678/g.5880  ORF Transcript_1678/g.5880 Transcript_1678/m.5880 type:complete len:798 (-) Transcript_1678:484-2877(-)|eukprot:CAMPEP_0117450804 /NCGR_PEP_ID=MMETSP0759-20121206/8664_1 /TAXON_ID=63605 /ORGANISM="Percolomonas cosmopolitus, Strain WS" /LENGTH=797 /DNA_ID=CAMNT_0005243351 /DNA_START=75 /DNA_END=2468 /DNA_ORIENTATION=+
MFHRNRNRELLLHLMLFAEFGSQMPQAIDFSFYNFEIRGTIATDLQNKKKLNFSNDAPLKSRIRKIEKLYDEYRENIDDLIARKVSQLDVEVEDDEEVSRIFSRVCWDESKAKYSTGNKMRKAIKAKWKSEHDKCVNKAMETRDTFLRKYKQLLKEHQDFKASVTSQKPKNQDSDLLESIPDASDWHILNIPSILEHLLSYFSLRDLYPCITVCREWYFFIFGHLPVRLSTHHSLSKSAFYRFAKSFRHFDTLEFRTHSSASLLQKTRIILSKATVKRLIIPAIDPHRMKQAEIDKFVQEVQKQHLEHLGWSSAFLPLSHTQYDTLTSLNLRTAFPSTVANKWMDYISHLTQLRVLEAPLFIRGLNKDDAKKFFSVVPQTLTHFVLPSHLERDCIDAARNMLRNSPLEELRVGKVSNAHFLIHGPHSVTAIPSQQTSSLVLTVEHIFDEMTMKMLSPTLRRLQFKFDEIQGLLDLSNLSLLRLDILDVDPSRYSHQVQNLQQLNARTLYLRNCPLKSDFWFEVLNMDMCEYIFLCHSIFMPIRAGSKLKLIRHASYNRKEFESSSTLMAVTETLNNADNPDLKMIVTPFDNCGFDDFPPKQWESLTDPSSVFGNVVQSVLSLHTLYYGLVHPENLLLGNRPLDKYIKETKFHVCLKCGAESYSTSQLCNKCVNFSYRRGRYGMHHPITSTMNEADANAAYKTVMKNVKQQAKDIVKKLCGEVMHDDDEVDKNGKVDEEIETVSAETNEEDESACAEMPNVEFVSNSTVVKDEGDSKKRKRDAQKGDDQPQQKKQKTG